MKDTTHGYVVIGFEDSGAHPRGVPTASDRCRRSARTVLPWLAAAFAACGGESAGTRPGEPRDGPGNLQAGTRPAWQTRVLAGDTTFDEVRFNVLPFLRRPLPAEDETLLLEKGPGGLALEFRIDWPGGSATVRQEWLRAWNVDGARVAKEAKRNLLQRHARLPLVKVRTDDGSSVLQLEANSPYQQSLVLVDVFWDKIAAAHVQQGQPLVAIPDRSRLIVLGSGETDLIRAMGPKLREFHRDSSEPLLDRFLTRDEHGNVVAGPAF